MYRTKGSLSEDRGHCSAKQNKVTGEGLELVYRTKGSLSEDRGHCSAKQNKVTGEGLELVYRTKGSLSKDRGGRKVFVRAGLERTGTSD